jgi:DNA helicase-2/ATP-dependent DNA helicase PcrA
MKQKGVQKAESLDYKAGDRVRHIKFGEGTVQSIVDAKKDYEVTVEFDKAGQKKMFASFAKLKKV